jgi:NAD(P)-dependent dehydrogenase (short-subunit alcohol dehydrogenase family)
MAASIIAIRAGLELANIILPEVFTLVRIFRHTDETGKEQTVVIAEECDAGDSGQAADDRRQIRRCRHPLSVDCRLTAVDWHRQRRHRELALAFQTEPLTRSDQHHQVRHLAGEFQRRFARLDVLLNNAGAFFSRRSLSVDGLEMTLALNHLAYFLLTHLLLDTLNATPAARIVNVASDAHRNAQFDFTDPQGRQNYRGWRAYSQSKLANLLFTYELARRLADTDTTANAMHPGFVATRFGHNNRGLVGLFVWLAQFTALSPEQGAETLIHLATSPDAARVTGMYFVKKQPVGSSTASYDTTAAQRLWQLSAELTGLA